MIYERPKVRFFICCTNFLNHHKLVNIYKNLIKFWIVGKPWLSCKLKWKVKLLKVEIK